MGIYFVDFDVEFHPSCRQDSPLCHELNIFHCRQPVQEFCVPYYVLNANLICKISVMKESN